MHAPDRKTGTAGPLAFAFHPRSFSAMEIARAADGVCDLVWLVDRDLPGTERVARLLPRLGAVVDVTGLDADAAAERLANHRPGGILALADALLPSTARIRERLGLPGDGAAVARRLTDKHDQRVALRDAGLAVPGFWPVPDAGDEVGWARLAHAATFPAVLKPRRSESSRNTLPVGSMADLRAAVASLAATEASGLVLEAYLADRPARTRTPFADYVSVESLVSGGRVVHLATNGRFPTSAPFRETGFFIPADLPGAEDEAVRTLATAAVRALGVGGGLLHTEIKLTPDGPRVIEVNGRIGGGVAEMLRRTAGLELLPLALRLALGQDVAIAEPQARGVAYILLVQPPTTIDRVTAIEGLDAVRDLDGVEVVAVNRAAGEAVDWRAGTEEFAVGVEGRVADHAALAALATRVQRSVVVRGERTRTRLAALAAPALLVAEALGAAV